MKTPRIVDNDRDEITAELDGREIRGWSYANDAERRVKMRMAHEFAEGWYQASKRGDTLVDALRAIEADPHGCIFCDSGKLRNPTKRHDETCGFAKARAALAAYEAK